MNEALILRHLRLWWHGARSTPDKRAGGVLAVAAMDMRAGLADLALVDLRGGQAWRGKEHDEETLTHMAHFELMATHHVALHRVRVQWLNGGNHLAGAAAQLRETTSPIREAILAMIGLTSTPAEPAHACLGLCPASVDGPAESHRRACTAIASYRDRYGRGDPPGMSREAWRSWVDARHQAEDCATKTIFELAHAAGALLLPLKWGNGFVSMHPDTRREGAWRTTTFTEAMDPSGHMEWNTPLEAAHLLLHNALHSETPPAIDGQVNVVTPSANSDVSDAARAS